MVDQKEFSNRIQNINGLVQQLESIADPAARSAATQLLQSLMDLHGTVLNRMMEIVHGAGESGSESRSKLIDELGQDPLVSGLLVLYGLHPDDLTTRVERKMRQIASALNKMAVDTELLSVQDGNIRVRARITGHACGSTAGTARSLIENALYEAAPDMNSLVVEGLAKDEPAPSGFVALDVLMRAPSASSGDSLLNAIPPSGDSLERHSPVGTIS